MVLSLFDKQFMINNNPYNMPERPLKQQRKVAVETSPLYPHQANRTQDELELKNRIFLQKRATLPQFL